MTTNSYEELTLRIIQGEFDNHIDQLIDLLKQRRKNMAFDAHLDTKVGDIVVFNDKTRPKYLIGARARVHVLNRSTVKVSMLETRQRYVEGTLVDAPYELVTKEKTP